MNINDFVAKYNGKGVDFDGAYGNQCVDLANQYVVEVLGQKAWGGNAVDKWTNYPQSTYTRIENSPTNFPQPGDIMIWGTGIGQYGHIAVCISADVNAFTSFDQNWPIGSVCHPVNHNYKNILGWLRFNQPVTDPPMSQAQVDAYNNQISSLQNHVNELDSDKNQLNSIISDLNFKLSSLTSAANDKDLKISNLQAQINDLSGKADSAASNANDLQNTINSQNSQISILAQQIDDLKNAAPTEPANVSSDLTSYTFTQLVSAIITKLFGGTE